MKAETRARTLPSVETSVPAPTKAVANMVVLATGDNVGIALRDIEGGESARSTGGVALVASEAVPLGHKLALRTIAEGDTIVRLGVPVGIATTDIAPGRLVHIHNVRSQYLDNVEQHYE